MIRAVDGSTAGKPAARWAGDLPRRVVAVALVVVSLLLLLRTVDSLSADVVVSTIWQSSDTRALVVGADVAIDCMKEGTWRGCGLLAPGELLIEYPEVPGSAVDRFPPLLYIPALLVQGLGGGQDLSLRIIGMLSLVSFGGLIALPWLVGARTPALFRHRHLWAGLILASPLLPYAGTTWSEVHAAALLAAVVALVAADAPPGLIGLAALGAGLSKDTAPPFVLGLALAVARRRTRWWSSSSLAAVLIGSVAAAVLTAGFNLFRFDSFTNITYLASTFQVREPRAVAGQAIALLVAPNGGLFPFWPASLLLVVLAGVALLRSGMRLRLAVVGAVACGFVLSLALWWSPFGWWSWSPRLMLPLVPAVGVAVLVLAPPELRPGRPLLLAAAAAVVLAVPQFAITGNSAAITPFMSAERPACAIAPTEEQAIVRCTLDRAWNQQPGLLVEGARGLRQPFALLLSAATAVAGIGLVLLWAGEGTAVQRRGGQPRRERDPDVGAAGPERRQVNLGPRGPEHRGATADPVRPPRPGRHVP